MMLGVFINRCYSYRIRQVVSRLGARICSINLSVPLGMTCLRYGDDLDDRRYRKLVKHGRRFDFETQKKQFGPNDDSTQVPCVKLLRRASGEEI